MWSLGAARGEGGKRKKGPYCPEATPIKEKERHANFISSKKKKRGGKEKRWEKGILLE